MPPKLISHIVCLLILLGCAAKNLGDLEKTGIEKAWLLQGGYEQVSYCLLEWLEREDPGGNPLHYGIGHSLHYRPYLHEKRVEIHQRPGNWVILYVLSLSEASNNQTMANLLVEPYTPGWKIEALLPGLDLCGKPVKEILCDQSVRGQKSK